MNSTYRPLFRPRTKIISIQKKNIRIRYKATSPFPQNSLNQFHSAPQPIPNTSENHYRIPKYKLTQQSTHVRRHIPANKNIRAERARRFPIPALNIQPVS